MEANWTEPLISLFSKASTVTGIYIKNQYIMYISKCCAFSKSIDRSICYIQKHILNAHNLNMDGELNLRDESVREEYLMHLGNIKRTLESWETYTDEYKRRHESEYAWDDAMRRSIFIDPRAYDAEDKHIFRVITEVIMPNGVSLVKELNDNLDAHILETKRENEVNPYPYGFETQPGNRKPYLIQTIHDIQELSRDLLQGTQIIL